MRRRCWLVQVDPCCHRVLVRGKPEGRSKRVWKELRVGQKERQRLWAKERRLPLEGGEGQDTEAPRSLQKEPALLTAQC